MSTNPTPIAPEEPLEDLESQEAYALSPLQEGMLVHTLRDTGVGMYINQALYRFRQLDAEAFRKAWQQLVARHTILRSSFHWENLERPLQRVHDAVDVPFEIHDWGQITAEDYQAKLREFLRKDRMRGFDLTRAPLLRIAVIRSSQEFQTVVWTNHHIILDGWSSPVLLQEMRALYDAALGEEDLELPEPRPYREFIEWLELQEPVRTEAFWRNYLSGIRSPTPLPTDQGSPEERARIQFGSWTLTLDAGETVALQTMVRRFQVTLHNVVQGAWAILLSRYSGENDVVFGILVSGRPPSLEGVETMVGMFLNSVPLRVTVADGERTGAWLRSLAATVGELQEYQHSPLLRVQEWSEVPPGTALFGSIVASKDTVDRNADAPTASGREDTIHATVQQNYPLHLDLTAAGGQLTMTLTYDSRRFAAPSVSRLMEQLGTVLRDVPRKAEQPISELSLMSEAERRRILEEWNETGTPVATCCLHNLFTLQAARTPEKEAVCWRGDTLSYRELDERSNRLAHHLRARGVGPETLVGLCVPRSLEMAVGLLAILKAGGAYVPLDPKFPAERLEFMMQDSQAALLLTAGPSVAALSSCAVPVVGIDEKEAAWTREPDGAPSPVTGPENLAYVLYTSGSTGQPKGVAIPHRVAVNRLQTEHDPFQPDEALCAKTTLGFVDSIWELFSAWKSGSRVTLIPEEDLLDAKTFLVTLRKSEATRIVLVPSLLRLLLESEEPLAESVPRLKHWISSGESLPSDLCRMFAERLPDRVLTNLYGTSEVWDATLCDSRDFPAGGKLPIGRPMGNVRAYILDEHFEPTPIGVQGELYIGGAGVARGYWRQPAMTAEKFVPDPFAKQPGARLYRTGDCVRWRSDGNIEYVGRLDQQFKLRGFRIEAADIESTLRRHPEVSQAAVVLLPGERLAAYCVAAPGKEVPSAATLRTFGQAHLPEPMRPALWIPLESMPLTPSGKINRRALPEPEERDAETEPAEDADGGFQSETEQTVARIWSDLLGVRIADRSENFFALGGHSLMATRAAVRLSKEVEVKVPLKSLFDFPTVAGLAEWMEKAKDGPDESEDEAIPDLTKAKRGREVPLSFSQRRLWFLDQLDPGSVSYTVPNPIRFHGPVDPDALANALLEVVRRHESLRTTFVAHDGEPFQIIHPAPDTLEIPVVDLTEVDESRRQSVAQQAAREVSRRPWDLSRGPLFRASLIRISDVEHILALTMHHIITDGRSMGILAGEMAMLYRSIVQGHPSPLPPPAWQYADFAIWQRDWMRGERLDEELGYWKSKLGGAEVLDLPTDHARPAVHRYRGGRHAFHLDGATAEALAELCRESGATHFMALLAGFTLFLSKFSRQRDISVGTPIANRNREELENIVGFFVNTLVMRSEIEGDPSFHDLLESVRKTSIDAFAHQDVPFEKLVDALQPKRDLSRHPLFQVMFVHQEMAAEIRLPGMSWKHNPAELETSNFDLLLVSAETADGVDCTLQYNSDLFAPRTVERTGRQLQRLFEAVAQDPARPISGISLLDPGERHTLLAEWSTGAGESFEEALLHGLVERQCAENPEAIAAESADGALTYGDLDRQANRLASRLQACGAGPDRVVAMFLHRSPKVLVCLLGILKAGAAFVALDPSYPRERLKLMLETTEAPVIVTDPSHADLLPETGAETILLAKEEDDGAPCDAPPSEVTPANLAYVVFTSGSTGLPKGVMVEHHNVAAIVRAQIPVFQIDRTSRVLQMVSLSFDASIGEIFRALCAGATLVFESKDRLLPGPDLVDLLIGKEITAIALPPSALAVLPHDRPIPSLRTLTTGGEACPAEVAARWGKGRRMINGHGPSETTIGATAAVDWSLVDKPPLGRPLAGVTCYVLDAEGEPVPAGFPGEPFIGGAGVTRGYLGRPDLTVERFLPDPFSSKAGARLYRTGDLVRWLPNGDLDFLGRVDQQKKVGVNDNFFEIGGDSILSIQMLARASREGIDLTPKNLFQRQTVGELAAIAKTPDVSAAVS